MHQEFEAWSWVAEALESFSIDLKLSSKNINAVLIGKAQEGKTTLALSLLGATRDEIRRIEPYLRAGRKIGQSATQVATIYTRAAGNITQEYLHSLQERVKKANKNPGKLLRLAIRLQKSRPLVAEVIDLVGLSAREYHERKKALEIAEEYLKQADLLIYVSRADHISDFASYEREVGRIMRRWNINKETSIFVLSYAYEVSDSRTTRKLKAIEDAGELFKTCQHIHREKILAQLQQRWPGFKASDVPLVLPVNLNTGNDVREAEVQATKIAIGKIRDILESDPVRFKAKRLFTYFREIEVDIEEDTKELQRHLHEFNRENQRRQEEIAKLIEDKGSYDNEIKKVEEEITGLALLITELRKAPQRFSEELRRTLRNTEIQLPESNGGFKTKLKIVGRKESKIQTAAGLFILEIEAAFEEMFAVGRQRLERISAPYKKFITREAKRRLKNTLGRYLAERESKVVKGDVIVPGWIRGVKWEDSLRNLQQWAWETKNYAPFREIERIVESDMQEEIGKQEIKIEKKKALLISLNRRVEDLEKRLNQKTEEYNQWCEQKQEEITRIKSEIKKKKEELQKARLYKKHLVKRFIRQWNTIVNKINTSNDPLEIIDLLGYTDEVINVFEELGKASITKEAIHA